MNMVLLLLIAAACTLSGNPAAAPALVLALQQVVDG